MNVDSGTRHRAVLRIYKAARKRKGCTLNSKDLEKAWRTTGLRRADLQQALRDLVEQGLLLSREVPWRTIYELTYLGERAMALSPKDLTRHAAAWIKLQRARLRRLEQAPASAYHPRRVTDSP